MSITLMVASALALMLFPLVFFVIRRMLERRMASYGASFNIAASTLASLFVVALAAPILIYVAFVMLQLWVHVVLGR